MAKLRDWIDHRTGYRRLLHALLLLNFPVSRAARWRYVWGGSLALMFIVELVTGTLLMTVYAPSEASAWGSVHYIETQMNWGWFIRGVHHYTSHMMLVVILIHMLTLVLTAGYRKPKEFTYWSGLLLGGVVLALAISGNPLPWDQKGYWAYQIETGILGTMPLIGSELKTLLVGGSEFGHLTLTRLYTLHVVVLPVVGTLLLVIHVALMRREKLQLVNSGLLPVIAKQDTAAAPATGSPGTCATNGTEPYWPFQTTRNLLMFGVLMSIVVGQLIIYPRLKASNLAPSTTEWAPDVPLTEVVLETPADQDIPYVSRPEWYVRFLYELRHKVPKDSEVLITGLLPLVLMALLFLMPFYESVLGRRVGYTFTVVLFIAGLSGIGWLTFIGIRSDHLDPEFQASRRRDLDYAGRAIWLARENGISPDGPRSLLHNDSKAMGPLLFAANCAVCHTWNSHDGTGNVVMELVEGEEVPAVPTAGDLHGFGSRKWIEGFLSNPASDRYFGHIETLKEGEMTDWAANNVAPEGPLTPRHLHAVAALLARETARPDDEPADDQTLAVGVAVFSGAELKDESGKVIEFDGNCLACHNLKAGDPDDEGDGYAPDLNGYGSRAWLIDFIRNPGLERFYGDNNTMSAFDKTQLSDRDLRLLVDWMRGEWARAKPQP